MPKSLQVWKKVVPLQPQSRNKQCFKRCPDGGIGRRAGLKHQWIHFHPGSTPGLGTERRKLKNSLRFSFLLPVTRWFADRLMCTLVVCRSLYLELINLFSWFFFSWTFYYRCIFKYFANLYCYWSWFVIELHVLTGQDIVGDRLLTVTCFDNSMK